METQILIVIAIVAAVVCVFLVMNFKANVAREERQDQFKCQQVAIEEGRKHERWLEERRTLRDENLKPEFTRDDIETLRAMVSSQSIRLANLEKTLEVHLAQAKKVLDSAQTVANQAGLALGVRRFPPSRES